MNTEQRQQFKFFMEELITFAILFLTLGIIINFAFQKLNDHNINGELMNQKMQITKNLVHQDYQSQLGFRPQPPTAHSPFQANIIMFNREGQILNQASFNKRDQYMIKKVKLRTQDLNRSHRLTLNNGGSDSNFQALLIRNPQVYPNGIAYVLILENIDGNLASLNTLRIALAITLITAWILAIVIAYVLSKNTMRPIVKAWQRQREFSSNAAHELRTPLTVIRNQLEYLLTKPNAKVIDESRSISTSLNETQHLQTLIQRLLTLARSDSGLIQIQKARVDIKQWFAQIIQPYSVGIKSQHKQFNVQINASGTAEFDPDLIHQLLVILLDNSVKYTDYHNGKISFEVSKIHHNKLRIMVANNGTTISNQNKHRIFERFYRIDKSRNSKTGGNGLGLAIAKWIVNEHHGSITVADNQPHGVRFIVTLPIS
ncbi:signal transduction histidine kinase [Philodulcilactobacillus myokoensis]|uniref:histidine kinase n=1 Tax=Philodulcilactobacillus myokoensis TaxID=2929573 RepID=A0A9W6ES34_9LACO|nr:HAMP domain-containing sensor histidine kinase [Philodulcilactobacillus myokoensis]GLB46162.1 signal transduction histidine kinase [Philodulcilactobacillus myokoensis]